MGALSGAPTSPFLAPLRSPPHQDEAGCRAIFSVDPPPHTHTERTTSHSSLSPVGPTNPFGQTAMHA